MTTSTKKKYLKKFKKEAQREIKRFGRKRRISENEDSDDAENANHLKPETKRGIIVVFVFTVAIIFVFSLFGGAGQFGNAVNIGLQYLFGWGRYAVPVILLGLGWMLMQPEKYEWQWTNVLGICLLIVSYSGFLHLVAVPIEKAVSDISEGRGGGYIGLALYYPLLKIMGSWLTGIILGAFAIAAVLILFDIPLKKLLTWGGLLRRISERFREFFYKLRENMDTKGDLDQSQEDPEPEEAEADAPFDVKKVEREAQSADGEANDTAREDSDEVKKDEQTKMFSQSKKSIRKIDIPIDLLESSSVRPTSGDIDGNRETIRKTFENFGIDVEMGETQVGPTVTQFTLKPAEGVKISQITTLSNDLALALAAHPIRIEAPIPGKSLVGIEVPNQAVAVVKLKELLMSREYKKRKSKLTIALGKDVAGHTWLADLDPMPHLLIAGATGAGKSVCLNSVLLSLLYQNSPDELKLILVDPKRVEMTMYNGIPHLLTPVVNEVDKTINTLRWVVAEMDRRFDLLSKTGHRNIQAYNKDNGGVMPYLVLAIDELADLMTVAANEVEAAIIRLAQMARAVGIHLVLATQRPSVDIITGLIKANITSRIAFSVASAIDSRTILDTSGAEKLLGRGDLLYISPQLSKPKRLQGAYVTDQEITRVLNYIKSKGSPEYQEEVTEKMVDKTLIGSFEDMGDDELVEQAKELVIKAGKASASLLQRRLRVGYARAARLLDILEEQGVIGQGHGAKPREVFIDQDKVAVEGAGTDFDKVDTTEDETPDAEDENDDEEFDK